MTSLERYLDLTLQLNEAERELSIVEKRVKGTAPPPKIDTQYYHDIGASLHNEHFVVEQLQAHIKRITSEKTAILHEIKKSLGLLSGDATAAAAASSSNNTINDNNNKVSAAIAKISFSSFSEVFEAVASELLELYNGTTTASDAPLSAGLKLFVHDRLGHAEPPLHFTSWEQRFQQRIAQAKDKVGKVKQGLVNIANAASITFKDNALVKDVAKWTAFVKLLDDTLVATLDKALGEALSAYLRQLQGRHTRELFAVNLKLTQSCTVAMIPSPQDLTSRLSTMLRQTLFTVCPDNAVAHVISTPTNLTKDGAISPKKIISENSKLVTLLATIDGVVARDIAEGLAKASAGIQKEWERYWSPAMATAACPTLLKAITAIQSDFAVAHSINSGAVQLNAFPLQDAVISMLHVQVENAKDNEIKSLVDVWTKAMQTQTSKETSGLSGASVVTLTAKETRTLDAVAESSVPADRNATSLPASAHTLDTKFDPLAFAQQVLAQVKNTTTSASPATATPLSSPRAASQQQQRQQQAGSPPTSPTKTSPVAKAPAATTAPLKPLVDAPRPPSQGQGLGLRSGGGVTASSTATGAPIKGPAATASTTASPAATPSRPAYTTMTVEEVRDSSASATSSAATKGGSTSGPLFTTKPQEKEKAAPTTPRDVNDSAAEFRRRIEQANSATAAANQRKEELRLSTPRSPHRSSSISRREETAAAASNKPYAPTASLPPSEATTPTPAPRNNPSMATAAADRPPVMSAWDTPAKAEANAMGSSSTTSTNAAQQQQQASYRSIIKNSSGSDYQPPSTAPAAAATNATAGSARGGLRGHRRSVEFDPLTATGGNGPSAAFKKASAPPPDDDETILRKLMQKEKESMERIRLMKEKDEARRKELAAAHRRAVLEEETNANVFASTASNISTAAAITGSSNYGHGGGGAAPQRPSSAAASLTGSKPPPLSATTIVGGGSPSPNKGSALPPITPDSPLRQMKAAKEREEEALRSQERDRTIQQAVAKENEKIRLRSAGGTRTSPTRQQQQPSYVNHTPSNSPDRSGVHHHRPSVTRNPIYGGGGSPAAEESITNPYHKRGSLVDDIVALRTSSSDPLRPEGLRGAAASSSSTSGRPDSALRRKLALPNTSTTATGVPSDNASSPTLAHHPAPPPSSGMAARKPQTAPAGNATPRGSTLLPSNASLDPRHTSLLDMYRTYCAQSNIKPNSGLLKILPKTAGENISKINLDLNYIGVKGFQPLLQILKVNRGLTFLNLKDNNLENNEIRALVATLCSDCGDMLQHLDLSNNPISLAGGTAIMDLIGKQRALTSVVVNGTLIQPKIIDKIGELLANKK